MRLPGRSSLQLHPSRALLYKAWLLSLSFSRQNEYELIVTRINRVNSEAEGLKAMLKAELIKTSEGRVGEMRRPSASASPTTGA